MEAAEAAVHSAGVEATGAVEEAVGATNPPAGWTQPIESVSYSDSDKGDSGVMTAVAQTC